VSIHQSGVAKPTHPHFYLLGHEQEKLKWKNWSGYAELALTAFDLHAHRFVAP
jgi:hypothetical protein